MSLDSIMAQTATNFGPLGLLILYLIWKETRDRKDRLDREHIQIEYDRERLEADKKMASTLAALTAAILKGRRADDDAG